MNTNIVVPKVLNGYPVVLSTAHRTRATVMVDRARDFPDRQRYAVATWWPELGSTWWQGHYDNDTWREAHETFSEVEQRNAGR
jgi:hypothetical protein